MTMMMTASTTAEEKKQVERSDDHNSNGTCCIQSSSWLRKLVEAKKKKKKTKNNNNDDSDDVSNNNNSSNRRLPLFVLAPMVDQSDLPFRLLTKRYGCDVTFTPMIHAKMFCQSAKYRSKFSLQPLPQQQDDDDHDNDRPLIVQLCGSSTEYCLQTALALEPYCDGVDINCGCPQNIARRGNYGAFLLEKPNELVDVVQTLVANLRVPVSCKVRLLPRVDDNTVIDINRSLDLYKQLADAGISLLTIHGRTRHQKGHDTGPADWDAMAVVVKEISCRHNMPVFVNGSISSYEEAIECWKYTHADGIMSSEAILEYPALFMQKDADDIAGYAAAAATATGGDDGDSVPPSPPRQHRQRTIGRVQLAYEYLELALQYPPDIHGQGNGIKCVRMHLHRILHADLQSNPPIRQALTDAKTMSDLQDVVESIETLHKQRGHIVADETLSWYMRHRHDNNNANDGDASCTLRNQLNGNTDVGDDVGDENFCFGAGLFGGSCDDDDE